MERKQTSRKTKRTAIIATLLACVLLIGGTVAWLTYQNQLTNTFTVGDIKPIDPTEPGGGPGDGDIDPDDKTKLDGNLYEPSWVADSKIFPGEKVAKDPYVGVGAGSEACYVYVSVNNTMKNNDHIYFDINPGWEEVEAQKTPEGKYIGGIFRYKEGLTGIDAQGNVWTTTPLFSVVVADDEASAVDFEDKTVEGKTGAITVQSFQHQMYDGDGNAIPESVARAAAKEAFTK